jgi:tryptophan 2,3-dioxygenase
MPEDVSKALDEIAAALESVNNAAEILKKMTPSDIAKFPNYTGYCHWLDGMIKQFNILLRRCKNER